MALCKILKPAAWNTRNMRSMLNLCKSSEYKSSLVQRKFYAVKKTVNDSKWSVSGAMFSFSVHKEFRTSTCRRALPPLLLFLFRPITKFIAVVFGRSLRVWWKSLPQTKKNMWIQRVKRHKYIYFGVLMPLTAGMFYFVLCHIEEDPITKRKRFIVYSQEQMIQLSEIEQSVVIEEFKDFILLPEHPVYKRVERVANHLLASNTDLKSIHERNWTVIVVDLPDITNAFVLPNGTIFIFTGMLAMCTNDDQLGVILAHEISHCLLSHMAESLSNSHFLEVLLILPVLIMWAVLPDLGAVFAQWLSSVFTNTLFNLPFSRKKEIEADKVGLQLAAKACFDVREASAFWGRMRVVESCKDGNENEVEWLSTHPSYERRQFFLDSLIPSAIQVRDNCKCPKLSLLDPRVMVASLISQVEEEEKKRIKISTTKMLSK